MKNTKAKEVIKRLEEENKWYTIQVLGNEENKNNAFAILLNSGQGFNSTDKEVYHGINKKTIALLKEAEIKFKVLN